MNNEKSYKQFVIDADRFFDASHFLKVLDDIRDASLQQLRDANYVAGLIRAAGLVNDSRMLYGEDNVHMNHSDRGLWQIPTQLAPALVHLSGFEINTMIEIGTWSGWTITFMGAYLTRFNRNLVVTTVDIGDAFFLRYLVGSYVNIHLHVGTSADFVTEAFDLAFIDGDHSYISCAEDYKNVGRSAKICMFHDINDANVATYIPNDGGVPRFWRELVSDKETSVRVREFLHHSEGSRVMGIGLVMKECDSSSTLRNGN